MTAKGLNPKKRRFVAEYLKDLNGTQAAIRSGYAEATAKEQACRLLKEPQIQALVKKGMDKRSERTEITQDKVLIELSKIAFGNMRDVASWNESGVRFKPSDELTDDQAATIQEVTETTNQHGGSLKIKQHDKVKALELIGRHLGMFKDKVEIIDTERPLEELSDAELVKKLKGGV